VAVAASPSMDAVPETILRLQAEDA